MPVVNRCSFRWSYKGPEQSGHFNRESLLTLMRSQAKKVSGNRRSIIITALSTGLIDSLLGVPLYLIQIQSNAYSINHDPKIREQAHFPFCSSSLVACSKLALNSCSSAAESFTFSSFLQKRLLYVSNDLSPLQDHIIPVCILLNQESVVSPKQSVSLNSLILIL